MVELRYLENTLKRTQERFCPYGTIPAHTRPLPRHRPGRLWRLWHGGARSTRISSAMWPSSASSFPRTSWPLLARGLGGAHGGGFGRGRGGGIGRRDGVAGRNAGPGAVSVAGAASGTGAASAPLRAILLAARRRMPSPPTPISWRPAMSAVGADPRRRLLHGVSPPRRCRPGKKWDDAAAEEDVEGEGEWEDSLIPWNASTTDFAGRRRGPARLTGRVSRKTRHAPEVPLRTPDRGRRGTRCH